MVKSISSSRGYGELIKEVGVLLEDARKNVYYQVNSILVRTYWEIGKRIVEYEQKADEKIEYGSKLFEKLVIDLRQEYGKGFSRSNVIYMRLFFQKYPKSQTVSDQLSWSHYVELLMIDDDLERSFYERQVILEKWSLREFRRQKKTALFERLALSKDKKKILELAGKGQVVEAALDIVKDPYVLEFLNIPEKLIYSERELEQKIIDNLQVFLLELGKGFAFVARQYRMTVGNKHYYIDVVFYNHILKCFVLIDLKINSVTHADIGQMNMYLNYFKKEIMNKGDNQPVGIILTKEKERLVVEYALGGLSTQLFVSKYQIYLPNKKDLEEKLRKMLNSSVD